MAARKQKLSDSLRLQQLFRDVEDEETWIREKEPIASSTNRGETEQQVRWIRIRSGLTVLKLCSLSVSHAGKDLIGVQNLLKKHQALQAEISGHEPRIKAVTQKGEAMVDEGTCCSFFSNTNLTLLANRLVSMTVKSVNVPYTHWSLVR